LVNYFVGLNRRFVPEVFVQIAEFLVTVFPKLLKNINHKIGLLIIIDQVVGSHDPVEVKGIPVGGRVFQPNHAFRPRTTECRRL